MLVGLKFRKKIGLKSNKAFSRVVALLKVYLMMKQVIKKRNTCIKKVCS